MRSKVSDVRFISHGISPSGIFSNDRFGTTGSDSRRRVVCERLKVALPVSVRGAFIKYTP
jgi:hypothetical protein